MWKVETKQAVESRAPFLSSRKIVGGSEKQHEAFDSLAEFLKEGKIDFLQKAESLLEVAKESRYRIVAVVGLFDKGLPL